MLPVLLLLSALAGCGWGPRPAGSARTEAAPGFALQDLSGKTLRLSELRGKIVLLDFWATWCGPCLESVPLYQTLFGRHRDDGLVVAGVNEDDDPEVAAPFAKRRGVTYPILSDPGHRTRAAYGVRRLPSAFLIDERGNIVRRWTSFDPAAAADMENAVESFIAGRRRN